MDETPAQPKLRAGTEVLIRARVQRQTSAGDHGIDSTVVWVSNPLSTTRSTTDVSVTVAPSDLVVPAPATDEVATELLRRFLSEFVTVHSDGSVFVGSDRQLQVSGLGEFDLSDAEVELLAALADG